MVKKKKKKKKKKRGKKTLGTEDKVRTGPKLESTETPRYPESTVLALSCVVSFRPVFVSVLSSIIF